MSRPKSPGEPVSQEAFVVLNIESEDWENVLLDSAQCSTFSGLLLGRDCLTFLRLYGVVEFLSVYFVWTHSIDPPRYWLPDLLRLRNWLSQTLRMRYWPSEVLYLRYLLPKNVSLMYWPFELLGSRFWLSSLFSSRNWLSETTRVFQIALGKTSGLHIGVFCQVECFSQLVFAFTNSTCVV